MHQPQATNPSQSTGPSQIQYQDVWLKDKKHSGFMNPPWTLITKSRATGQEGHRGWKQDQVAAAMAISELQEEAWDWELIFPTHPINWEQAVSQATAMGESGADAVGEEEVKAQGEGAMPDTEDVIVEGVKVQDEEATVGAMPDTEDVIVKEVEVQDDEAMAATNMIWAPKNTSPKVIDENLDIIHPPAAASTPVNKDMPNLEDQSFEEPKGEEPKADGPSIKGHPVMPWVHFEAQVCQDKVWYLAAMFMWFRYMYFTWEERKKNNA